MSKMIGKNDKENRLKVLFISDVGETGGASLQLIELVTELKNNFPIIPVVLNSYRNEINSLLDKEGIENYSIGYRPFMIPSDTGMLRLVIKFLPRLFQYYFFNFIESKFLKYIFDIRSVDIVHSYINRVDYGAKISKYYSIPHVWHIHEFGEKDYKCISLRPNYIAYMNSLSDNFIAISNAVKDEWINKGIPKGKITTIYNGVKNLESFRKDKLGFGIVMVGTICDTKGQAQLIRAVAQLPEYIKNDIYVDIWGSGTREYIKYIDKLISVNHLENTISLKGYSSQLGEILSQYSLGITASRAEGFGRVTIEYMLSGLAVIASDTGANPELIEKTDGLLYKYGNEQDLAKQIALLYDNRELLKTKAENSYRMARDKFLISSYAKNIYNYYEGLVNERNESNNNSSGL